MYVCALKIFRYVHTAYTMKHIYAYIQKIHIYAKTSHSDMCTLRFQICAHCNFGLDLWTSEYDAMCACRNVKMRRRR